MAIVTTEEYNAMLDKAKAGKFAYPAINVTSSQTLTAALEGFTKANSDGIIQVSVGGAEYWSGSSIKDRVAGSLAMAAYAREVAKNYPINVALHTDHCAKQNLDSWVLPLMELEAEEVKAGREPFYQSHMWDGSAIALDENIDIAVQMLEKSQKAHTILEIEIGAVGGEEDGVVGEINDKLYTSTEDAMKAVKALGLGEKGRYITALTFGNVHGVYKPGNVKLRPEILGKIQEEVAEQVGWKNNRPFDLVMHGGSGSTEEEIALAVANGVIKMNVDTDTQYAFTRPVVDWMLKNYEGVLKIEGEVGNKKQYDPRAWGKAAQAGMADRVVEACQRLGSLDSHSK
ncbi:MAG: class II fructose-bisphosphate aldolase [Arcanobacterium sp.]|nr:class II fructose-bisphosphate aldolase [Arcanobacterium sp.]MDY5589634.1 class II fructose-bisphosphate aldolase [Arcanobacterium sp.]